MSTSTELPEVNRELFAKIRDQIVAHPEAHNQDAWETELAACGTARCTAGWAIYFTHPQDKTIYQTINREQYCNLGFEGSGKLLLGLTEAEAQWLFYAADDDEALEMIKHYAEHGREGWEYPA